ncbi:MAG TPA: nicotinate-nucleotide adenylyltransferase [Dissulfurispiraceae bacterium]|nr:nicotinate-nucleotide adenylyltransferase [Dissulfurispiraceae bacterium]
MRLGIFGGTFNPVHFGHLRAAEEVRQLLSLDKVIFIPSGNPPLKSSALAEASHRYSMTRLATGSNIYFLVSDLEMRQDERSYTVSTVDNLHRIYPEDKLFLILGLDAFMDLPHWKEPRRLVSSISFIVVTRPSCCESELTASPFVEAIRPSDKPGIDSLVLRGGMESYVARVSMFDISSTMIRRLTKERMSIKYLLPESVEQYIHSHNLYCE